jgi:tyrosinase
MPAVANPTWYSDIRFMFTSTDINHMQKQNIDLTSYDNVVANAGNIYGQVAAGNMPPDDPWTKNHPDWITSFLTWMTNQYPKGTNPTPSLTVAPLAASISPSSAHRIRKDINSLSQAEIDNLKNAFSGIIRKDKSDLNSYFVQAGYHWLPAHPALYCQHHVPAYNPWHRAYLMSFENALRSVPGCENITLPYWDITTPFPTVLKSPPFNSYTLPEDIGEGFKAGYATTRYAYDVVQQNLVEMSVTDDVNRALTKTDWEDFNGWFAGALHNTIIQAHDSGHLSIGPTMANQSVAAFDPVFWFFHANWDRLFWKWQRQMEATTLNGLLTTINQTTDPGSYQIFTNSVLKELAPFTSNPPHLDTVSIIDSKNSLDVDYQEPGLPSTMSLTTKTFLTTTASKTFSVDTNRVNVRVDGVNRLKIPGSFKVVLLRDGKQIASKGFFQPIEVEKCENCVKNAIAHFDFELPLAEVSTGKLEIAIQPVDKTFVGNRFPNKLMGNPTITVNLLMKTE